MFERNYSSRITPVYKYFLPCVWIAGLGMETRRLFLNPAAMTFTGINGVAPAGTQWFFLVLWLGSSVLVIWLASRVVWLRISGGQIYIRRFRDELQVDPRRLRDVDELWSFEPSLVSIRFVEQSGRRRTVWVITAFDSPPPDPDLASVLETLMRDCRVSAA